MSTPRRRGRETALQILCILDANPEQDAGHAIDLFFRHLSTEEAEGDEPTADPSQDRAFVESIVRGVGHERADLDEKLRELSKNWRVERMSRVDRCILRLALYELLHVPEVPALVALNEAIELAKRFGAEEAPAFVNGLLDSALKTLDIRK